MPTFQLETFIDAPLGIIGRVVERLILEKYMLRLISERNKWLKDSLENQTELRG